MRRERAYRRGVRQLKKMVGRERAKELRRSMQDTLPDFERYVMEFLAGEIWRRQGLEPRVRSLCTISALTALGRTRGLELNVRMALGNGARPREILEAVLQMAPYAGFPAAWEGLSVARAVLREEGRRA